MNYLRQSKTPNKEHLRKDYTIFLLRSDASIDLKGEQKQSPVFKYWKQFGAISDLLITLKDGDSIQKWLHLPNVSHLFSFTKLKSAKDQNYFSVCELDFNGLLEEYTLQLYSKAGLSELSSLPADEKEKSSYKEAQLLRSQINVLLNAAPEAILLLDYEKGTYITANTRAEELFGLNAEELCAKQLGELSPSNQKNGRESKSGSHHFLEQAANGKEVCFEWEILRADQTTVPVEVRVVRLPDPKRILLRSSIIDISDRKRYERRLKETEARYRSMFDLNRTAMVYHDYRLNLRYVNSSFNTLMGCDPEQTTITEFEAYIHHEDLSLYRENHARLLQGDLQSYLMELRCLSTDNEIKYVSMSVSAMKGEDGELIATLRMLEDITLQKQNEDEIRQRNEALEKMNRELDAFVYTVSHDIRAPLASLKGLIQLMRNENDPVTISSYCELQEVCIKRLDHFIQEIADYSRNKKSSLKVEPILFEELISQIFDQHLYMIYDRGKVNLELNVHQPIPFYSDSGRINIILNNLISNGIRYSDDKKQYRKLRVEVNAISDNAVEILVIDNGIGMNPEHLNRIFDMFYRIDSVIEGTGIGLYIVKEALDRINGTIEVESVKGEGTTFRVKLNSLIKEN